MSCGHIQTLHIPEDVGVYRWVLQAKKHSHALFLAALALKRYSHKSLDNKGKPRDPIGIPRHKWRWGELKPTVEKPGFLGTATELIPL